MIMRLIVIIFSLSATLGCAGVQRSPDEVRRIFEEQPQCMLKRPFTGILMINNRANECEIIKVIHDFPAEKADLKTGDVITKFENVEIKNRYDFRRLMMQKSPGDTIKITIRRNGQLFDKEVQTKAIAGPPDAWAISDLLSKETPVNLIIVVRDINNILGSSMEPGALESWKAGIKSQLISRTENLFIQIIGNDKNFSLIDRQITEGILKEVEFQQSGMVSEIRAKLGKTLGATHLLVIDFSRTGPSKPSTKYVDTEMRRLVEIESGKIIASVTCSLDY